MLSVARISSLASAASRRAGSSAAAAAVSRPSDDAQAPAVVGQLTNGLTVVSVDRQGPLSELVLAFGAGSRWEPATEPGLVHHLRALLGADSKHHFASSLLWHAYENGTLRAWASRDLLGVSLTIPRDKVAIGLSLLGHVAAQPAVKPWDLRDVIESVHSDHDLQQSADVLYEDIHRAAYGRGTLAQSTYAPNYRIGQGKVSYKTIQRFAESHLVSGNGVLVGVNVEPSVLRSYAELQAPVAEGVRPTLKPSPFLGGEHRRATADKAAHVLIAGEGASAGDARALAVQAVLLDAIGRGPSTKYAGHSGQAFVAAALSKALSGQSVGVAALQAANAGTGLAGVYLVAEPTLAEQATRTVVGALRNFTATDEQVAAAKAQAHAAAQRRDTLPANAAEDRAAQAWAGSAAPGQQIELIPQVTTSEVNAAAKKLASRLAIASVGAIHNVPLLAELQ